MPSRNSRKIYLPDSYYHIYNRGVNKRRIFLDDEDYRVFLNLLKRYLSDKPEKDNKKREYPWLQPEINLLAYCLMPNHFHLLVYQITEHGFHKLLKNVCGSYTKYFNHKYQRVGPLFQDRYKASMIIKDDYLQHISRYIHLNPREYKTWQYSSLPYYIEKKKAEWIAPSRILELFTSRETYADFMADYEDYKRILKSVEEELANS